MNLLSKLKSVLGLGTDRPRDYGDQTVRFEAESGESATPETATERAVKTESPPPAPSGGGDASATAAEPASETAEEAEPPSGPPAEPSGAGAADVSVTEIKGVGPAYAERLAGAGIDSVEDLAGADADALAAETDLSATRLSRWIERARAR